MSIYEGTAAGAFGKAGGYIDFRFEPNPEVLAQRMFEAAKELDDLTPPLSLGRQIAIDDMRSRFDTHTSPDGSPWVAWSESYTPDALANNLGGILERTLDLRGAATSPEAFLVDGNSVFFSTGGLPEYWSWNNFGAERGSGGGSTSEADVQRAATALGVSPDSIREAYAGVHEGGSNTLPARPFVGMSFEAELQVIEEFDQWFQGVIAVATSSTGRTFGRHALRDPNTGRFVSGG